MAIKAIETVYRGYRFRSRLEARWAVYFDGLGLRWRYESTGWDLPSGPYLPDFALLLPDMARRPKGAQYWVEVKGCEPTAEEKRLCRELTAATNHRTFLVVGDPIETFERGYWVVRGGYAVNTGEPTPFQFTGAPGEDMAHLRNARHFWHSDRAPQAATAARQARFEHGENGAPA